jgi:hypothetical protein
MALIVALVFMWEVLSMVTGLHNPLDSELGLGLSGRDKRRILSRSETLRAYGFPMCPWMDLPTDTQYPRRLPKTLPPAKMIGCVKQLAKWTEKGDITFMLMEGQGLAAMMGGGYHGGSDDDDLDMRVVSRRGEAEQRALEWCGGQTGQPLGFYGFASLAPTSDNRAAFVHDFNQGEYNSLFTRTSACIGSWEGIELLLPDPRLNYFRIAHGGSFWVPPVQGGKDLGNRFIEYMNPSAELYSWFDWLRYFHDGLMSVVDADKDGVISAGDFLAYLRGNDRVNQKWLGITISQRPCVVANALAHYSFVMRMGHVARSLRGYYREGCGRECADLNWDVYQELHGPGPRYFAEGGEGGGTGDAACAAAIREEKVKEKLFLAIGGWQQEAGNCSLGGRGIRGTRSFPVGPRPSARFCGVGTARRLACARVARDLTWATVMRESSRPTPPATLMSPRGWRSCASASAYVQSLRGTEMLCLAPTPVRLSRNGWQSW